MLADFESHMHTHGKADAKGSPRWAELDYNWWVTMPAYAGAKAFYDVARKLGTVKFLTGPTLSEECFSGKARWVQTFVPERGKYALEDLIICPAADKQYLAASGRILIDDRIGNIQRWQAAGGIGIHHAGDFNVTLQVLRNAIPKPPVTPLFKPR